MDTSVSGTYAWALKVTGFVTGRASSSDSNRYSLVVLNCGQSLIVASLKYCLTPYAIAGRDSEGGSWNPQPGQLYSQAIRTFLTYVDSNNEYRVPGCPSRDLFLYSHVKDLLIHPSNTPSRSA